MSRAGGGGLLLLLLAGCVLPPAPAPRERPERLEGWIPYWTEEAAIAREAAAAGFTDLLFFHGTVDAGGGVRLEDPEGLERGRAEAVRGGARAWLTVTNHGRCLEGALGAGRVEAHAESLLAAFAASRCDDLDLDYEQLSPGQAERLPELVRLLAARLPARARLSLTLQPVDDRLRPWQRPMVRELLAMPRVHTLRFMMYDYAWRNSLPGGLCPLPEFRRLLDAWAAEAARLTLCLPLYGYDWPRPEDTSLPAAETLWLRDTGALPADWVWMRREGERAGRYVRDGVPRMVAAPSLRAVRVRAEIALAAGVPALSFWHLGGARPADVAAASDPGADLPERPAVREEEGWDAWLIPFKRRVCRVVTGDGGSLAELAERHGVSRNALYRFNQGLTGSPRGRTVYLPLEDPRPVSPSP